MELRDYIETDAYEIIKWINDERDLRLWSADRYKNYPVLAEDINDNYNSNNLLAKTLVDNNKIIGHLILRTPFSDKYIVRFGFIIVNPALRGKGYGKVLLDKAIDFAKNELHAKEINLGVFDVNKSAYFCYKSVGFLEKEFKENSFCYNGDYWNLIEMYMKI